MEDSRDSEIDSGPGNGRWSTRVWAPRALVGVAAVAIAAAGGVHPPVRALFALLALIVGAECLRVGIARWTPGRGAVAIGWAAVALAAWSAVGFVPLGPGGRELLQPGLADALGKALDLAGRTAHPLAVNPRAALGDWAVWVGLIALGAGSAAVVRTGKALRQVAWTCAALASAVAALGLVQRLSGASSVYWVTGLGEGHPTPFFGPFVSQNHAAAWLASIVPIALAGAIVARRSRVPLASVAVLIAVATVATGSRSAWPLLAVGLIVAAFASGRAVAVRIAAGLGAVGAVAVLVAGPVRVATAIASRLGPEGADPWSGRLALWGDAARLVGDAPLVGVGLGGFGDAALFAKTTPHWVTYAHAHQEPLELAVEIGLPALIAGALALVVGAVWGAGRLPPAGTRRTLVAGLLGSIAVIAAASLWDFPLRAAGIAATTAVALGAVVGVLDAAGPPGRARPLLGALGALGVAAIVALFAWVATTTSASSVWGSADADPAVAIARRPLDVDGPLALAEARWLAGDGAGALQALDVALAVQPTSERAWLAKARLHRARGEPALAADAYRAHLALDVADPSAWASLSEALSLGVPPADVLPERPDRRCWAARVLERAGDPITAQKLYEETATLHPRCAELYAEDLVDWGEAAYALDVARHAAPGCGRDRVTGFALEALGRHADALVRLDAAMRSCPKKDTRLRVAVGRARVGLGDPAGLEILEHLVAEQPDAPWIRRALIRSYDDLGRPDRVRPHLEALRDAGVATPAELARIP